MKRQSISIATNDSPVAIEGYMSPAFPGIAVHRHANLNDLWNATHIGSGLAIACLLPLRRSAVEFATVAARLMDFTQPGAEVESQMANLPEVRTTLRELAARLKTT